MAGKIKNIIDQIINKKAEGDPILMKTTRLKLILKGINVDHYSASSEDDLDVIAKLKVIAEEFDVQL